MLPVCSARASLLRVTLGARLTQCDRRRQSRAGACWQHSTASYCLTSSEEVTTVHPSWRFLLVVGKIDVLRCAQISNY